MAEKKQQTAPKVEQKSGRSRHRKSAMERRCLSKMAKRMFHGMGKLVFREVLAAERNARRGKVHKTDVSAGD